MKITIKKILNSRQVKIIGLGGSLILAGIILASCDLNPFVRFPDYEEPEVITHVFDDVVEAPVIRRRIDGKPMTDEAVQNLYPAAVIVENAADAWPLSGIDKAQIVYEALAESYIPRLLAIYASDEQVEKIGPVRSARPYFVDWADGYQGLFMHVGGSNEGLYRAKNSEVTDVDEFRYGGIYFWRSRGRYAPHNTYTSSKLISDFIDARSIEDVPEFRMWTYTDESSIDDRPEDINDIVINFTTETYKARWKYDREANEYVRFENERPFHTLEGDEIRAKNIIVSLNETSVIDSVGRKKIVTVGEGDAWIFKNGTVIEGSWKKDDEGNREVYYDSEGNEIEFIGGTTWIEVIPRTSMLDY